MERQLRNVAELSDAETTAILGASDLIELEEPSELEVLLPAADEGDKDPVPEA
jgi:hypothetical protein